jgi:hypothetical protein
MKLSSMKRGVEGTIALAQSHGEGVDWEKVGSSYARCPAEMQEFCEGEGVRPKLMSLILPAPAPLASAPLASVPSSSTSAPMALLLLRWRRLSPVLLDSSLCNSPFAVTQNIVLR